ncbi:hypothetical protein Syun_004178 [Stephania yunnanensis]|uniref:Uncharacterized protein n=1 Tax=Stephania yunnanensis TaxID=152371 RepID=A0AAP0L2U7_9MAGN
MLYREKKTFGDVKQELLDLQVNPAVREMLVNPTLNRTLIGITGVLHTTGGYMIYTATMFKYAAKVKTNIPSWLSPGAQNLIRRILDPNPITCITITEIKEDGWFNQDYIPSTNHDDEELEDDFRIKNNVRKIDFISNHSLGIILEKIEDAVMEMGLAGEKINNGKITLIRPSHYLVELNKSHGDSSLYRKRAFVVGSALEIDQPSERYIATEPDSILFGVGLYLKLYLEFIVEEISCERFS